MQLLTNEEIYFIKGVLKNGIYLGNTFCFCADEYFKRIGEYLNIELPKIEERKRSLYDVLYKLTGVISNKKIKEIEINRIKDINDTYSSKYIEEEMIRVGIKLWFEKNLIVRIKRPDTIGNKGDYVGFNEEKDSYYRENPLFIKFDNKEEYNKYIDIIDYKEIYTKWFKKNEKLFTKINLSESF